MSVTETVPGRSLPELGMGGNAGFADLIFWPSNQGEDSRQLAKSSRNPGVTVPESLCSQPRNAPGRALCRCSGRNRS